MAKQQYINGHYFYAFKAGILTDGLGIVRHTSLFDDDFKQKYPDIVSYKTDNPCTTSSYGKCAYTYPDKEFRLCSGIQRDTEHWNNLYHHRVTIERTISLFKSSFGINNLKTNNTVTIKANLYIAGIIQLIGVVLSKALNETKLYKSVRNLISKIA